MTQRLKIATTIRLPDDMIEALKRAAKKEFRTPRAMARMLIIEGLLERGYSLDDLVDDAQDAAEQRRAADLPSCES